MLSKLTKLFGNKPDADSAADTMTLTDAQVLEAVAGLIDANTGKTYAAAKAVKNIKISADQLALEVVLAYPAASQFDLVARIRTALPLRQAVHCNVSVSSQITSHAAQRGVPLLPGVKNVIAVASGKGGVGKSTTAVNLALALQAEGARVGILDADIYGPSQPLMLGLQGQRPETPDGKSLQPIVNYGIQTMSIGYLVDADQAMVWRGPMVSQALQQLLNDTRWDNLDYLVIDMPPGTGDIQLTLSQKVPVTGALIVTTRRTLPCWMPARASPCSRKWAYLFWAWWKTWPSIFAATAVMPNTSSAKAEPRMAADFGVEVLGSLPLDMGIRLAVDEGKPTVAADPDGAVAALYKDIARKLAVKVGEKAQDFSGKFPKIVIQNN
jgi:ATP-binding protein involved in chromosome partitioning